MMLDVFFKALSDPTRREILKILRQGDLTAGEIAEHFNISKPSLSHHLNVLKQADLVLDERKGQYISYSLNTSVFQDLLAWFVDMFNQEDRGDRVEKKK
ncbi:Transcriptional repressor SdpR [Sporotomaculum syntrophicum]|uniref:Transcriptional repressor SdpR n=2 Tax=Sporotomaculum syntrophicum TaxID=182264 RepID=A0A9D3AYV4_9FIRM|nr:Transcriptional repressor SdpR [Sporotomaculum syntrophicum]